MSIELPSNTEGDNREMCKAMDDLKDEGRLEGKLEVISKLIKKEGRNFYEVCDLFDIPAEEREILKARL